MTTLPKICDVCGHPIPNFAPGGNCPRCLFGGDGLIPSSEKAAAKGNDSNTSFGSYELVEKIGEGGFGIVYRAEQTKPVRRTVALKILKPELDGEQVMTRFRAERQALALMSHPGIARIFDAGQTPGGQPWFALEYSDGCSITEYCRERKLSIRARLRLILRALRAIEHAHQKGLIHRDIKPSNLLVADPESVTGSGEATEPQLKVIDFGLAKATEQLLTPETLITEAHRILGTPEYMSPEQSRGEDADTRTDLYALGAVLYELLAERPPFEFRRTDYESILTTIRETAPPRPSAKVETLPNELDWIVLKALEKEPDRRYASAAEFIDDIQAFLDDRPVHARPPSKLYLLSKFVRRNRLAVFASVAILTAILTGSAMSLLSSIEATKARGLAELSATEAREALSSADYTVAQQMIERDEIAPGIAHLCRCLRIDPTNEEAAFTLMSTLATNHFLPLEFPPTEIGGRAENLFYIDGGKTLLTVTNTGIITWRNKSTGKEIRKISTGRGYHRATISPDKTSLGVISQSGFAQVFATADGAEITPRLQHSKGTVIMDVKFSPDGSLLFTGCDDRKVRAWNIASGSLQWEHLGPERCQQLAPHPDGRYLIAGFFNGIVRQLDILDGKTLAECPNMNEAPISEMALSDDGTRLITCDSSGHIVVRSVPKFQRSYPDMRHDSKVDSLVMSPDGTRFATGSHDGTARVWNLKTGRSITPRLELDGKIYTLAFSPGGKRLAVGGSNEIRLWDAKNGQLAAVPLPHLRSVTGVTFSPDGKQLTTGGRDLRLRMFDLTHKPTPLLSLTAPTALRRPVPVLWTGFQPDGESIVTYDNSGNARQFDTNDGHMIDSLRIPGRTPKVNVTRQNEGFLQRFNLDTLRSLAPRLLLSGMLNNAICNGAAADAPIFYAGFADGMLRVLNSETGKIIAKIEAHSGSPVWTADISTDGSIIATGSSDGVARIFCVQDGSQITELRHGTAKISHIVLGPKGKLVAVGGANNAARIFDLASGTPVGPELRHEDVTGQIGIFCAFTPDGERLITAGSQDLTARIWDTRTGKQSAPPLYHESTLRALRISPDGLRVATISYNSARLWSVQSGRQLAAPLPIRYGANWISFSSDGRQLAVACNDGRTIIWPQPPVIEEMPAWFLNLAESISGVQLNPAGLLDPVSNVNAEIPSGESELKSWARGLRPNVN